MRSITVAFLLAGNAFATPLDGEKLERLLGLEHSREVRRDPEAVPSPLPWRLLGTLRSREGLSFAAVECGNRSVTVQVGDVREGVEVVAIEQQSLIVARRGRLERIGSRPGVGGSALSPARSISRAIVERMLANPQELMQQAQLLPAMVDGRLSGFRARWVKEGSLAAGLGLQAGDVITRVNGITLDSLERVFGLMPLLGTTRRFEIEVQRSGQRVIEAVELER